MKMKIFTMISGNIEPWKYPTKWAYQRASKGYCDNDLWDLSNYYLDILYNSLNELANRHVGYPGNDNFPTSESWEDYLRKMARCFYRANENNEYYSKPAFEKWAEYIDDKIPWGIEGEKLRNDEVYMELTQDMEEEVFRIYEKRDADLKTGFEMLKKVFGDLWD